MNTQAGWKALTGTTDFGMIASRAEKEGPSSPYRLAYDIFVDRILGFVGSYFVKLEGRVDALVFSGGIGEHSATLRGTICDGVRCLGFANVDAEKNSNATGDETVVDISVASEGREDRSILVCRTDEQASLLHGRTDWY